MRRQTFLLLILLFATVVSCGRENSKSHRIDRFEILRREFSNPPVAFRSAPLWVWNDRVTPEKIDRDLADFKAHGIGGVFVHPRYGLITEYLSDEWFSLFAHTVQRAKELGMHVWIYDENSYPSGFAGGHVPAEMPDAYRKGQGLVLRKQTNLTADVLRNAALVLARQADSFLVVEPSTATIPPADTFYVFQKVRYRRSKWFAGYSYVDLLEKGVTEKFLDVTLSGYKRVAGSEFGHTVPGVFTDEPHIRAPRREAIRWTPSLFSRFRREMGYDLRPHLVSLFERVGNWRKVRHDYRAVLLHLFVERWGKVYSQTCERLHLIWTGHYWEHAWPNPDNGPDNMAMYAWHQMPAIDMLFNRFDEGVHAQFGNIRSVREVASVASQLGRARVLCETYGGGGWELTFQDQKRLGDWEFAHGINFLNQHLAFMSIKGDRKQDYPQSFSRHEPWWPYYRVLADYFARLSLVLSSGTNPNRVLVIEPTTTAWFYARPGRRTDRDLKNLGKRFQQFVNALAHHQVEFDLGSEAVLADHGCADGAQLRVGKKTYDLVVLPPGLENLESSTLHLLLRYVRAGGKLISFVGVPEYVDGQTSDKPKELVAEGWTEADSLDQSVLRTLLAQQGVLFGPTRGTFLFHQHRRLADGDVLFLVNSSLSEAASGAVTLPGRLAVQMDAVRGKIYAYPSTPEKDGRLRLAFELPPAGSLLLFVSTAADSVSAAPPPERATQETVLNSSAPTSVQRDSLNVLTLDYCDLQVDTLEKKGIYYYEAQKLIWQHHGYPDNPWSSSSQYRTAILDSAHFGPNSGFVATFPFEVTPGADVSGLLAVVERPHIWRVRVNGQNVQPLPGRFWVDPDFGVYPIGRFVRTGRNEIQIICRPMSIFAELEPVYVLGEFSLAPRQHGWAVAPAHPLALGAWKDQGMPFYSHSVTYTKRVELKAGARVRVRLGKWAGTVAVVRVNGHEAGVVGWPPYEVDVTRLVRPGLNDIQVVVVGSLKNVFGPHHLVKQRGIVAPPFFRRAPAMQPAGPAYDTLPYGLFEDFEVVQEKAS